MNLLRRLWHWYWPPKREWPDWQGMVDDVALAASIWWQREPQRWVAPYSFAARTISNHYHMAIDSGNLPLDAVDGELFRLDAALEME